MPAICANFPASLRATSAATQATAAITATTATPAIIDRLTALAKKLYPNREAALTAIKAVHAAATLPFEEGLLYETELANGAKVTGESKALVHVFFAERDTRKVPGLPADAADPASPGHGRH